ncbi:MAG TPA: serine hydrolase [Bacteroidales bacterium]|jgi:CubicO group peptidase (beta-lactamase class C family)|nr:serine hydrolase [Bacteroidales bacterium]
MIKKTAIFLSFLLFFLLLDLSFGYSLRSEIGNPDESTPVAPVVSLSNDIFDFEELSSFEHTISHFLKHWGVTGASVAIAKDGKLVYAKGFGYANREEQELMQPYHLLRVASVSKLITATAVMKLVEAEKLSLDSKVFGEEGILSDKTQYGYIDSRVEQITIKQLLNHSAGWTTRWGDHLFMHESIARQQGTELPVKKLDVIQFALAKRLHYTPGGHSSYSNLGYLILECIIEKVSSLSYEAYVTQNILNPIGIYDAFIAHNFDNLRYPLEARYYEVPEALEVPAYDGDSKMVLKSRGGNDIRVLGAAGGWVISSVSLIKFLVSIDPEREGGIISSKSAALLAHSEPGMHPLGWRWISVDGTRWRTGSFAGTSALAISRSDGFSYVFITNTSPWVGSKFPYEVNRMMARAFHRVDEWPEVFSNSPYSPKLITDVELQDTYHELRRPWECWDFTAFVSK